GKSPQIAYGKRSKILARIFTRRHTSGRPLTSDLRLLSPRHPSGQPARRTQKARVAVAWSDELHADRQTVRGFQKRQADRRHAAQCPQRAERRVSSRSKAFRRAARSGRRENRVIALLEQLNEALLHRLDAGARALVINRSDFAPARKQRSQRLRETITPFFVLPLEIRRHLGIHDRSMPLPCVAR